MVGKWIEDECIVADYAKGSIASLYDSWKEWAGKNNEHDPGKRALGDALEQRGFLREKGGKGTRIHIGLDVKSGGT